MQSFKGGLVLGRVIVVGLVKQKVCRELLVFIAREVGLNGSVAVEAETA